VLLLVTMAMAAVVTVRRSFPLTSGTVEVPGLNGPVRVLRDAHGVPQLYADTADDLFRAQGYVQAQDRFYEMDVRRHLAAGRLSELVGRDALEVDTVVRTLGWRRVATRELALLDPRTVAALEAFAAGVNAYVEDRSPGELSLEYTLLGAAGLDHQIEEWSPVDSLAWLKAMAWDLRGNMRDEVERASLSKVLAADRVEELFPAYPYAKHRPIVEGGAVVGGRFEQRATVNTRAARPQLTAEMVERLEAADRAMDRVPALLGRGGGIGSNAWVVDGERSKTGQPILANDPHLAASVPGVWYQMGLHCTRLSAECPYDVAGFTFAGFPGVIIGHNRAIAWGFTNLRPDVTDLYLEAVRGDRYRRGDRWRRLEERTETIRVADGEPFTFTVRSSIHGPLISDVAEEYAAVGADAPVTADSPPRRRGYAVALSWTALTPGRTADAVLGLARADNWASFRAAARDFAAPSQNMVYADVEGHIGYQAPGVIPIREAANRGEWPSPGWDPAYDWTGRSVPFRALPSVLDPEDGFVATANQAVTGPGYPFHLGSSFSYGYRSQRIIDLLLRKGTLSIDDMAAIQLDTRNEFAATLVPFLLDIDAGSRYYSAGQGLLDGWDLTQPADSAAAAYFNAVWRNLLDLAFADQLPPSVAPSGDDRWFEVVTGLLQEPNSWWWDDADTPDLREARDDVLRQALRDARDELVRRQSRRVDGWTWGHHHTLTLRNQTIGRSGSAFAARLLNRGPWELGGGSGVVDATSWNAAEGYQVTAVPTMRMVVSMADLDASTWVNLTGASGHAFSEHYTDQTDLWAEGRTLPWAFTSAAIEESTEDTLTLWPPGQG
jgi:penicillin amidase